MIVNLKIAAEALSEAMSGRTCSSAWLGYGNVLFLSFEEISFVDVPLFPGHHQTLCRGVQSADEFRRLVG